MATSSRRSGPSMAEIHDRVLDLLRAWQAETSDANRLFYLRRTRDERFEQGYWFPGNEQYLNISFWSGSDSRHKTSNAYLRLHQTNGCYAMLVARDSPVKRAALTPFAGPAGYEAGKQPGTWFIQYSFDFADYETALRRYLHEEKPRLDAFLAAHDGRIGEEYETPFGFLNEQEFNASLQQTLAAREQRVIKRSAGSGASSQLLDYRTTAAPYRLSKLVVYGYQGIKYTEISDLPPAPWVFLTGDNGYGKTSVLRAIVLGMSSPEVGAAYWGAALNGSIEAYVRHGDEALPPFVRSAGAARSSIAEKQQAATINHLDGRVLAYGPNRLLFQSGDDARKSGAEQSGIASLFGVKQAIALRHFDSELLEAQAYEDAAQDQRDDRVAALVNVIVVATAGQIQGAQVRLEDKQRVVRYAERITAEDGSYYSEERKYEELATGLRGIINLVTDIYVRFTAAQNTRNAQELTGIVIIDELENHLHPRLQRMLPGTLSKVFPGVQFIVSTHSPIPFLGAPAGSVFLRVNRDKERGITVEQVPLEVDVATLLPNAILSSPLFGFNDFLSDTVHEDLTSLKTDDSYQEAALTTRLREKFLKIQQRESENEKNK